jgi:hypothetical protein
MFLLEHVVAMNTVFIRTCGNYKEFLLEQVEAIKNLLEHVVTIKIISIGTCGNYYDCFYLLLCLAYNVFCVHQ